LGQGEYKCVNEPISALTDFLESYIGTPVLDRTGLTGGFDCDLKWDEQRDPKGQLLPEPVKRALIEKLGLELVPGTEPIEMLVVKQAN
jgi:uncharacterized protein (TIGR03435 family)